MLALERKSNGNGIDRLGNLLRNNQHISDDPDVVRRGIDAVTSAIATGVPGILGIHIEGPFLNVEKRGTHPENKIRQSDSEGLNYLQPIAGGKTLVTLAPECVPPEHIKILRNRGFSICAGHTNASFEELCDAFNNGVEGVTHLFNAMSPLVNRASGAVGAALDHEDCWCCIIVDGRHVRLIAKFGGRYLVRGGSTVSIEGQPPQGRLIVLEFPSMAAAKAFLDSDEYRPVAEIRYRSAASRLVLSEGIVP